MANQSTTLLDAFKTGNPLTALASIYDTVEVRTNFSPPVRIGVAETIEDDSPQGWFTKLVKPTLVMSGNNGRVVVAPAGEAGDGTLVLVGLLLGLVGIGFVLGRVTK